VLWVNDFQCQKQQPRFKEKSTFFRLAAPNSHSRFGNQSQLNSVVSDAASEDALLAIAVKV
jgi:hypothetical protein